MIKWMKNFLITNSTFWAVWALAIVLLAGVTLLVLVIRVVIGVVKFGF